MRSIRYELNITPEEEKEIVEKLKKQIHAIFDINDRASQIVEFILNNSMDNRREYEANYNVTLTCDNIKLLLHDIRNK